MVSWTATLLWRNHDTVVFYQFHTWCFKQQSLLPMLKALKILLTFTQSHTQIHTDISIYIYIWYIFMSICLYIIYIYIYIYIYIHLPTHLSYLIYLSAYLWIYLSTYLSINQSINLPIYILNVWKGIKLIKTQNLPRLVSTCSLWRA